MTAIEQLDESVVPRRYEYDDGVVISADFGPGHDVAVDVLGDTVIVVVDGEQYEIDVDGGGDPRAFIRNGVLTIEVER